MVAKKNNKGLPTLEGISWKTWIDLLKYMEETVIVAVSRTKRVYMLRQETKNNSKVRTCTRRQK